MKPINILIIFGTRPEVIKLFPVIRQIDNISILNKVVVSTSQHFKMIQDLLAIFEIKPDIDLKIMEDNQSLADISTRALKGLDTILQRKRPNLVLVQGDTTTAFIGALVAFYHKVPIGHIEAGLRSQDKWHPFPEEINRRLISLVADLHFAPTASCARNLVQEGIGSEKIFITGNTVVDSLEYIVARKDQRLKRYLPQRAMDFRRRILVTAHRRENWGKHLEELCRAIQELVQRYPDLAILFPVHLNPIVKNLVTKALGKEKNVFLIDPLPYDAFIQAIRQSYLVITDSGGVQEECPSLKTPVLVFRKVTERPENIDAGGMKIVGLTCQNLFHEASRLLDDPHAYRQMVTNHNPYGDGHAAKRICQAIMHHFVQAEKPEAFVAGNVAHGN